MSEACLFCRIARREIPATIVLDDDEVVAFRDIHPQAPTHLLVIPRRHIEHLSETAPEDRALLGRLLSTAAELARREGVAESGYRVVVNTRESAGQTVFHLHLHLLGGRRFTWPPG